ncbi:alginate O-acetyltransferase AlgF [Deinococcus sp.]|uniref:alginate O-acetyltransferase AlgF n=1 Tax=Deinococcus sp. TaxID=47478 RepID=UPI003C7BCE87
MKFHRLLPLLLAGAPAFAQDTLYQAAPPANAAFVRVVNALDGTPLTVTLAGQPFEEALAAHGVGAYHLVLQGSPLLALPALHVSQTLNVAAGHFYTVALSGTRARAALSVLGDAQGPRVTQARLSFYNLSASPASLLTSDGKVTLVQGLAALGTHSLDVNPVNVQLRVEQDGHTLTTLAPARLQARSAYSVFVFAGSPAGAIWVPSSTRP